MAKAGYLFDILNELEINAEKIEETEITNVVELIIQSKRIFIAGAGRSGFVARAFSNRLMHLGLIVYFVGEPTTPALEKDDLLIIGSGSGETSSLVVMAQKAFVLNAKIITITIYPEASIGRMATRTITIPGATPKSKMKDTCHTIQPMGNAFEQMSWLIYDVIIMYLMKRLNITESEMYTNHANLE